MAKVLDQGHVELIDYYGDELRIVNFARASFGRTKTRFEANDAALIAFLLRNRHGTPFEAVDFTFHVKAPLMVAREWFRHRIGSFNEISGRYVELKPEFYIPDAKDIRTQKGKPGSYSYEPIQDEQTQAKVRDLIQHSHQACYASYQTLLRMGVAKELARSLLPLGLYTQFFWKVNARSLMNFLSLRNAASAMAEIRYYAAAIETTFEAALPRTHAAFVTNGRLAP